MTPAGPKKKRSRCKKKKKKTITGDLGLVFQVVPALHTHDLLVLAADHISRQSSTSNTIRVEALGVSSNV